MKAVYWWKEPPEKDLDKYVQLIEQEPIAITEEEFARSMIWVYIPRAIADFHRSIILFVDQFSAYEIRSDYSKGKITYLLYGCKHQEVKEFSPKECREKGIPHWGNCWHVYECKRCGKIWAEDSSD